MNVLPIRRTLAVLVLAMPSLAIAQASEMTFFVTSTGSGKGADFGGLAGADRHCQALATAAGAGHREWRAYLSASASGASPAVDARSRIGNGPWRNAKGVVIARSVDELHTNNTLDKTTALSEKGEPIRGRGDSPNQHDILTGSRPDGTAFPDAQDRTCGNWTSSGEGSAFVGHHDRVGLADTAEARSWNSSHASRGCSDDALRSTGGAGLIYCFAAR